MENVDRKNQITLALLQNLICDYKQYILLERPSNLNVKLIFLCMSFKLTRQKECL